MSSKTSWTSTGQDARAVVCFLRQWYIYWLRYNFFNCIQDILATAILYNHQHGYHHPHHRRLEYDFVGCILGIVVTDRLPMWQFKPSSNQINTVILAYFHSHVFTINILGYIWFVCIEILASVVHLQKYDPQVIITSVICVCVCVYVCIRILVYWCFCTISEVRLP